jgi:dihydrofolate reductase
MNSIPKYVFSKSLQSVDWKNTQLLRGDAVEELEKLKSQQGKDLLVFGSAELSFTFIRNHLLDEFRLIIAPVILGAGTPLFKANGQPLKLQLIKTRTFHNGNVLLYYSSNGK